MKKQTGFLWLLSSVLLSACSLSRQVNRSAQQLVLNDSALQTAHVGISIYEPATGRWWYNWQGDKYFVPASNTKLATCYAAMKHLGDSLVAARIAVDEQGRLRVFPSGDPTFLNAEFPFQPLFEKMKAFKTILWSQDGWKEQRWGSGWSWNDYDAAYMAERSPLPVYGNVASFRLGNEQLKTVPSKLILAAAPGVGYDENTRAVKSRTFRLERGLDDNNFTLRQAAEKFTNTEFPLRTDAGSVSEFLEDTLHREVVPSVTAPGYSYNPATSILHSQPTDSLLRPLMHRSDNFFAEQTLLMVSNEMLGFMNDEKIIDTLLKTDLADLPQQPRWVDGSGLSRYNLFTPQDFVTILNKMKNEFGMARVREILPAGGEGTLASYYKADRPYFFGKTGTLSGVVALSGFLTTVNGKELIVSVLVNNHRASATAVRRAVEKFLQNLREKH